jgi:hypothetical protein
VRLAQLRLLLEHGLRPKRVVLTLMPLDVEYLARQSLATQRVTAQGALTFQPRLPPAPFDRLAQASALARTAWFRTGRHQGQPNFHHLQLHRQVEPTLRDDVTYLFRGVARLARQYDVPVTVVLIPTHEQICKRAPFAFQDTLTPLLLDLGLGVCDPRDVFLAHPDKPALFIPDKHFAPEGNRLLLDALLRSFRTEGRS